MYKITYDNIRKRAIAEFIPDAILDENVNVRKDIYGFAVEIRAASMGGARNFGHGAYFKVYQMKPNGSFASSNSVVRIYFTKAACVKHKSKFSNWILTSTDKKNINKYLEQPVSKLSKKLQETIYSNMTLYSFLILLADKLIINAGTAPSNLDIQIINRSAADPTYVGNDFISIYYPKPDYSNMEYVN